jgi:hypothetical protein
LVALGGASRHRPPADSPYHDDPFDAHIATSSVGEPKPKPENAVKVAVVGLASLLVVLGSVVLGLLVALGRALSGGRLGGMPWAVPATQVAHNATVTAGLVSVLCLAGQMRGARPRPEEGPPGAGCFRKGEDGRST